MQRDSRSPLVSIGVPVYNEESDLPRALDSLLAQTYDRLEVVVSDNRSTDRTPEIAHEYARRDQRVKVIVNERNLGMVANFNQTFRRTSGEYFMWAAADDRWDPAFVARCLDVLQADQSVVLAYPQTVLIDDAGGAHGLMPGTLDTRHHDRVSRFVLTVWGCVNGNPVYGLIRSSGLRATRLFRNHRAADKVLLAELALIGAFAHIPQPLFYRGWLRGGVGKDEERYRQWMRQPNPAGRLASHRLRLLSEHLGLVWHAALPLSQRIALCAALLAGQAAIHGWNVFRPVRSPSRAGHSNGAAP